MHLPVDNILRVAVVDALDDLFHEHGGVFLGELPSGDDLIEELSTLADSAQARSLNILDTYSVTM